MVNILITGVAGLIGSRLADYFVENYKDYNIIGIDDLSGGYIENVNDKVKFYQLDLSKDDISFIFDKHKINVVYHFACYAAEGLSPFLRKFNYSNNVLSTVNLINESINYKIDRFVYASSMSVYGHGDKINAFDENDILLPIDPYAISKYACELDLKAANLQHGLDYVIVRPHNVFGKKQNIWDRYRNVIGIWMYEAINDQPNLIYGDGEQKRSFTYIDNILPSLVKCGFDKSLNGEVINLGGIIPTTINETYKIFSEVTGYNNLKYAEPRYEVKCAVPTYQKSIDLLGYEEVYSLKDGIKYMWEWAKMQPNRERKKWINYEINDKIYSYWK